MAEESSPAPLHELAQMLRQAHHLGPEAQKALADLVDELSQSVDPAKLPPPLRNHLTENAAHLVNALHPQADAGLLANARQRLEAAAVRLEAEAPQTTGILRRLIDTLANLGI